MTTMRTWIAAALVAFGGCAPATRGTAGDVVAVAPAAAARPALVGSWHLIHLEAPGPDGTLRRMTGAKGSLIYTPTGQVSVQVMYPSTGDAPSGGPVQYAAGGYEGTFGRYTTDEATRTVTHRYEGANVRTLVDVDLPRRYEIAGNRLVLRSTRADEHWAVTWERDGASRPASAVGGPSAASSIAASGSSQGMMVRISEIQIDPARRDEYNAILKEEAEASVRLEPGVISIFPMYQRERPTEVRILEIYASRAAYESHIESPHFQKYKTTTLPMVKSLTLVDMALIDPATMPWIFAKMQGGR
jgi:quinol monooxygenase YgiN